MTFHNFKTSHFVAISIYIGTCSGDAITKSHACHAQSHFRNFETSRFPCAPLQYQIRKSCLFKILDGPRSGGHVLSDSTSFWLNKIQLHSNRVQITFKIRSSTFKLCKNTLKVILWKCFMKSRPGQHFLSNLPIVYFFWCPRLWHFLSARGGRRFRDRHSTSQAWGPHLPHEILKTTPFAAFALDTARRDLDTRATLHAWVPRNPTLATRNAISLTSERRIL
jgi:hypothetical protein